MTRSSGETRSPARTTCSRRSTRPLDWPAGWAWLYAVNQGLHIVSGLAAIPILLAKLWTVMPKLWERPALRSLAHSLERLSLALLVGASLFVFFTGVLNIQIYYAFGFGFVSAHYYGTFIFLAALVFHVAVKLPDIARAFRERGVLAPLREDRASLRPEPPESRESAPTAPRAATVSRRGFVGAVGLGSAGLGLMAGAASRSAGRCGRSACSPPAGATTARGPTTFRSTRPRPRRGSLPRRPARAGGWSWRAHGCSSSPATT